MTKTELSILEVLKENRYDIIGSRQIMRALVPYGVNLTERTIRYHLRILDEKGLTVVFGKNGRKITDKGFSELENSNVSDKVGFISSKIETLSFLSDFNPETQSGKVVLNVSLLSASDLPQSLKILRKAFKSKYVMSKRIIAARAGETIGNIIIPDGMVGIGTLCSVTVNSVFLKNGIPITSRYGGLMEATSTSPKRFTALISYDGCSLDPHIIFIRGGMTSVSRVISNEKGYVLASFREIPVASIARAREVQEQLRAIEIGGLLLIGEPNAPLLEIPVGMDKAGVVVVGGLNPIAALYERGIKAESFAMSELAEYEDLVGYQEALKAIS